MRCASVFLPLPITMFTRRLTKALLNFGSSDTSRLIAWRLLDITNQKSFLARVLLLGGGGGTFGTGCFWTLNTVFGTTYATFLHAGSVECSANDVITNPGKIFHTTTTHEHD